MENQPKLSKKSIMLNYGLMLSAISIIISLANYSFGDMYEPHWSINVISVIIMIVIIVLGIKKVKESNDGLLTLGEAIKTGLGIALVTTLVFMVYFYVFVKFIEPDFVNVTTQLNIDKALESNPDIPQETLDMQEKMTKDYFFIFAFGFMFILNLFIGFITSLITGSIIKKTDEEITSI